MKRRSNFESEAQLSNEDIRFEADWHKLGVYNSIFVIIQRTITPVHFLMWHIYKQWMRHQDRY